VTDLTTSKAVKMVRYVGCLLAVSHVAAFMKESHQTLGDIICSTASQYGYVLMLSHPASTHLSWTIGDQLGK
jgi:hypothetical protein